MTHPLCDAVNSALKNLDSSFQREDGELAYLALTSKPENAIRDRLAFVLHKFLDPAWVVAREYQRADLAVLSRIDLEALPRNKHPEPVLVIELKTWSLFTFLTEDRCGHHFDKMAEDLHKCLDRWKSSRRYCLLISTYPLTLPDEVHARVIKYLKGWSCAFSELTTMERIRAKATELIEAEIKKGWSIEMNGYIDGGKAFKTRVHVLYWLLQLRK